MQAFQLTHKRTSHQSGLTCYTYTNGIYQVKVFVMNNENQKAQIQYPVLVEPITLEFVELPQIVIVSETYAECNVRFPIDLSRLQFFQKNLEAIPHMVEDLKTLLMKIEGE